MVYIKCRDTFTCEKENRNYCCLECDNFIKCLEPCRYLLDGVFGKDDILNLCNKSKETIR